MAEQGPVYTLTEAQLAARLQVSRGTLRHWRQRGVGPRYCKLPGKRGIIRYSTLDVESFLAETLRQGTREPATPQQRAVGGR
jgi:transcriptional regulator with XRE-family HTH domain